MNVRQLISTAFLEALAWLTARFRFIGRFGAGFIEIFFPRFLRLPVRRYLRPGRTPAMSPRGFLLGYLFVFVPLFLVQLLWAGANDMLLPDALPQTRTFIEDRGNLFNYLAICELYCLAGYSFLLQTCWVRTRLRREGVAIEPDQAAPVLRRGYLAGLAIVLLAGLATSNYAVELHDYSQHYWFMSGGPPDVRLGNAGYYYLFTNFLLLLFMLCVGFAHFGLFHVARDLSAVLRRVADGGKEEELAAWSNTEIYKRRLAPLAAYVVTSKVIVFLIFLNLATWRTNQTPDSINYRLSLVILFVFGLWVFSLPRYAVQRHLFKIRKRVGKSDYPDIRGPWVLGLSSLLDLLLFTFIARYLLRDWQWVADLLL